MKTAVGTYKNIYMSQIEDGYTEYIYESNRRWVHRSKICNSFLMFNYFVIYIILFFFQRDALVPISNIVTTKYQVNS